MDASSGVVSWIKEMPTALRGANNIVEINIQVSGLLDQGGAHRPQGGGATAYKKKTNR